MIAGAVILGTVDRDCASCTEEQKQRYGCTEETKDPSHWFAFPEDYGWEPLRRCPRAVVSRDAYRAWDAYRWVQAGFLPGTGGIYEQPHTFRMAMDIVFHEVTRHRQAEHDALRGDMNADPR